MIYFTDFVLWTLLLYVMHRVGHVIPWLKNIHHDHHIQVHRQVIGWSWKNLLLYVDSWRSTADQWLIEVIPTLIFAFLTGQWWIWWFYYVWAAFVQEAIEHNDKVNLYPFLSSGKWHLIHHKHPKSNYGVFTPLWDKLFGTFKPL